MSLNIRVLFDEPQHEIASLLREKINQSRAVWIVTGFATVEGVKSIASALVIPPTKLQAFIIGASTYRGFEALDQLLSSGVPPDRLYVHLGHSRSTGQSAKHRFYRYHPMLHSKVYLLEMEDGHAVAIIGSHNITGYALLGLNGEAAVILEGPMADPEMQKIKQHIEFSRNQSVQYSPFMKDAFTWWTSEFIDGLKQKVNDQTRDYELKKTIVVLAVNGSETLPEKDDVIYFEIPAALRQINALDAEVHIYIFDSQLASSWEALTSLDQAKKSLWCIALGLEKEQGGRELQADWYISTRNNPALLRAPKPFRPSVSPHMLQVRVKVRNPVWKRYEYLFGIDKKKWEPVFDKEAAVHASPEETLGLTSLELIPPEDKEWFLVRDLKPIRIASDAYQVAMHESSPESGSFVLMSLRRRDISNK